MCILFLFLLGGFCAQRVEEKWRYRTPKSCGFPRIVFPYFSPFVPWFIRVPRADFSFFYICMNTFNTAVKKTSYLHSAAMDIILFGHEKNSLLGIWPSSSHTFYFHSAKYLSSIHEFSCKQLNAILPKQNNKKNSICHQTKLFIHYWLYVFKQAQR